MITHQAIVYDPHSGEVSGVALVKTPIGTLAPVVAYVPTKHLVSQLAPQIYRHDVERTEGVGFLGFLKDAWNGAVAKAKKIAKAIGVAKLVRKLRDGAKKVLETAKAVIQDPRFAAAVGIAAIAIPGAGPVIAAGYAATRAAMALADGVMKGDPAAQAKLGQYVAQATPGGQQAAALVQTFTQQAQTAAQQVQAIAAPLAR
jgi:hypothetical protein